ncbi:enolase-phosphatase E1 [Anabrus simplex]|uniref:enolase-phosphatase E1 n=1 Tax=Anabrus simplex TaxID=316456 RepID=UPI0035A26870
MGGTRFMVQWEEHPSHLATRLGQLLEHQTLVDVTLMCNTHTLRVHRAVLAACSPYFETILQRQLGMHPLIVLKDMQFSVLKSLIEFMYCGETSVTEDNLGALLQAAKFFQVKGLSAMTKEALGLVPNPKTTVNGDAARKAFVGRPKRVGIQQTFVTTSGVKTVAGTHAAGSHTVGDVVPTKTTFQTVPKPVSVATTRPDTQQQTESAQLLLSLSGSEFPKQTFHTVSKNVRFHHNISSGSNSAVTVEPSRTCAVDSSVIKKEVGTLLPQNSSIKSTLTIPGGLSSATEDNAVVVTAAQPVYIAEPPRKRGRPVKRQMNVVFQEKVMTDADMALHKEAEASRKALEMLRQEMRSDATSESSSTVTTTASIPAATSATSSSNVVTQITTPSEFVRKLPLSRQTILSSTSKVHTTLISTVHTPTITTSSHTVAQSQLNANNNNTVVPKKINTNIIYKTVSNAAIEPKRKAAEPLTTEAAAADSNQGVLSMELKQEPVPEQTESILPDRTEVPAEQVFQLPVEGSETATATTAEGTTAKEENLVEYQVAEDNAGSQEVDLENTGTNIVYQMADASGAAGTAGSVMSQYMEVLKEAGLPTDVPILLDSGDGSYVTVNEEVLMNIVNGGVLQCHVTEGNFVAGEGIEFVVQEMSEAEVQGASEMPGEVQSEAVDATTEVEDASVTEAVKEGSEVAELQVEEDVSGEVIEDVLEHKEPPHEYLPLPSLDEDKDAVVESTETVIEEEEVGVTDQPVENKAVLEEEVEQFYTPVVEGTMDVTEEESVNTLEGEESMDVAVDKEDPAEEVTSAVLEEYDARDDEVITGDRYGESAMEGFPVMRRENSQEDSPDTPDKPSISKPTQSESFDETTASLDDAIDSKETTDIDSGYIFHEESTSCEDNPSEPTKETQDEEENEEDEEDDLKKDEEESNVMKAENSEMSVEEALQEMMGESSDAEVDVCDGNTATSTASQDEGDSQTMTTEQRSPEQEAEELRLVLSPEEEQVFTEKTETEEADSAPEQPSSLSLCNADDEEDAALDVVREETENSSHALTVTEDVVETFKFEESLDTDASATSAPDKSTPLPSNLSSANGMSENELPKSFDGDNEIRSPPPVVETSECVSKPLASTDDLVVKVTDGDLHAPLEGAQSEVQEDSVEPPDDKDAASNPEDRFVVSDNESNTKDLLESSGVDSSELDEDLGDNEAGAIVSPNKDIPFAVGLLPLKTALEKLQAMPEYQPRKTRSSSMGKESAPDVPAARVKRKASSIDGPEKKQKVCEGEDSLSTQQPIEEDMDTGEVPSSEEAATSIKCHKKWQQMYEAENIEDLTVDEGEEEEQPPVQSMPELLTESTEG